MWLVWIAEYYLILWISSHVPLMQLFLVSCSLVYFSVARYDGLSCRVSSPTVRLKNQVPVQTEMLTTMSSQSLLRFFCWIYCLGPSAFDLTWFSGPSVILKTYPFYWNETMLIWKIKLWHLHEAWRVSKKNDTWNASPSQPCLLTCPQVIFT